MESRYVEMRNVVKKTRLVEVITKNEDSPLMKAMRAGS